MRSTQPASFKWRHFHGEVILQCVRWYCKYGISYRDLEEMMVERGVEIGLRCKKEKLYKKAIFG
jgi:IS6 family transposase